MRLERGFWAKVYFCPWEISQGKNIEKPVSVEESVGLKKQINPVILPAK